MFYSEYIQYNPNNPINDRILLISCSKILENSISKIPFLKREIKLLDNKNYYEIKNDFDLLKESTIEIKKNSNKFLNNLNSNQKFLIKRQTDTINLSLNNLEKLLITIDKNLNKRDSEEIFNKIKEIELELKTIYRQYKAIELILFE